MESMQGPLIDPAAASLHILLVDANQKSRQNIEVLLNSCNYQVTACKTSQDAIQVLKAQQGPGGAANFDLILKEHCPSSGTNAARFLRRAQTEPLLQGIPVIVASAIEDRDVMVNCLQLGAADFMLKPLRATELRNLWARVYWWRRATYHQPTGASQLASMHESGSGHSGSDETQGHSNEPQEAALDEGASGEGSVPGMNTDRSGGPSKYSKDNLGWSGTKLNESVPTNQQNSHNPSMPSQGNGSEPLTAGPQQAEAPTTEAPTTEAQKFVPVLKNFPPLDLKGRLIKPAEEQDSKANTKLEQASNPGFRAYVATEAHRGLKRPLPDFSSREDPGSSGSDWTGSLEKAEQNKRQAVFSSQGPNTNLVSGLSALTQAWLQGHRSQEILSERAQSMPVQSVAVQCQPVHPKAGKENLDSHQGSQSLPPGFPFCFVPGMLPGPFGMPPAFWPSQQNPGNKDSQGATQQSFIGKEANNVQQAQQAMHNQIMYHHNLLMQQYGMVAPFTQYSAFANQNVQSRSQEMSKQSSGQILNFPLSVLAKQHTSHEGLPPSSSQMFLSARSNTPNGNLASTNTRHPTGTPSNGVQQQSHAPVTESTRDTAPPPQANASAGTDGFLLEPSRKQRRAEALHKYKQKRKNLNFTKKIRYESRKQLAQARPRVKGQFVRITSEDVNAVVDSLTPDQMKEVAEGKTDVTDLLMESARQNAGSKSTSLPKTGNTKDIEISDEDDTVTLNPEEEDVSSPASKDCQKTAFGTDKINSAPEKHQMEKKMTRRNSSQSGSNSPETEPDAVRACA